MNALRSLLRLLQGRQQPRGRHRRPESGFDPEATVQFDPIRDDEAHHMHGGAR